MSNKIAFLFPGQGSQAVGMGRELAERFPIAAQTFAEADAALGFPLSRLCFEGPEADLRLTENTQPAIMTVSVAAARVLAEHGVEPALAAGHSLGEWSAHVVAGTLSFADAVRAVKARGHAMQQAVPPGQGAMAAVLALDAAQVAEACAEAARETGLTVQASQPEFAGADRYLRRCGRSGKGLSTLQSQRRAPRRHASRQRSLPLRAHAAGAGGSGACSRRHRDARSSHARRRQCHRRPRHNRRCRARRAHSPGHRRGPLGGLRECVEKRRRRSLFIEVGPGKVLCGLLKQIDPELKSLNVEDAASLEKTLAELNVES